jgi:hypothetical protein
VGLSLGLTASAQAQTGFTNGAYIASTQVGFVGCTGELQEGWFTSTNKLYARGWFTLNTSSRGLACQGWLERSTDSGQTWSTVSGVHIGADGQTVGTDYYYDNDANYRARVCVGDFLYYNSYSCGAGW